MSSNDTIKQRVLDELINRRGQDVFILSLFVTAYPDDVPSVLSTREMQQRLGPHIARINESLRDANKHVIPGELKNTYRLTDKTENE